MTIDRLREAVKSTPFKPFSIVFANGSKMKVGHPEMIAIAPKAERTFVLAFGDEEHAVIDLLMVAALEFRNGHSTRNRAS